MANAKLSLLARDFGKIREEAVTQIPKLTDLWTDFNEYDPGMVILELLAGMMSTMQFYADNNVGECFLMQARQRKNVKHLCRGIAYELKPPYSAVGTIRLTNTSGGPVSFSKYTHAAQTVETVTSLPFVIPVDVAVPANSFLDVDVVQGTLVTHALTSDGSTASQSVLLSETVPPRVKDIAYNGIDIWWGADQWTRVDSLVGSGALDKHFEVYLDDEDRFYIVFGDGIFGAIPPAGAGVAYYLRTDASSGNVGAGKVAALSPAVSGLTCANAEAMTGGRAQQTIEDAKRQAPPLMASLNRAVATPDYRYWILENPSVVKAVVWGEQEELPPNYDMMNRVQFSIVATGDSDPEPVAVAVVAALESKRVMDVSMVHVVRHWAEFNMAMDLYVGSQYSKAGVETAVRAAVQAYFALDAVDFGQDIYPGELYKIILAVEGVQSVVITALQRSASKFIPDPYIDTSSLIQTKALHRWEIPKLRATPEPIAITTHTYGDSPAQDALSRFV